MSPALFFGVALCVSPAQSLAPSAITDEFLAAPSRKNTAPGKGEIYSFCEETRTAADGFWRRILKAYGDEIRKGRSGDIAGTTGYSGYGTGDGTTGGRNNGRAANGNADGIDGSSSETANGGNDNGEGEKSPRRALPPPFPTPPFPTGEWQGFPLVGVPPADNNWP